MSSLALRRLAAAGLLALLSAGVPVQPACAEVDLFILPVSQTVSPGAEFEVTFQVANVSPTFNAFHFVVEFDPNALTTVPLSPLRNQIGSLITNVCPASNNVNWFHMGTSTDTVDVSMLCAEVGTAGPGTIYRMHFRASTTLQATTIRLLPGVQFANAGVLVSGVVTSAAAVGIGMAPLAVGGPAQGAALVLSASPNPARGDVLLDFGRPLGSGGTLCILDVQGRALRRITLAPGARSGAWDGRDDAGSRVPPGQYLAALRAGGMVRTARLTQVR